MINASDMPIPSPDGPIVICAVCARVLEGYSFEDTFLGYRHARHSPMLDNHEPIPIVEGSEQVRTRGRCDFCGCDGPKWRLPVRPFRYRIAAQTPDGEIVELDEPAHQSADDWAACDHCAMFIKQKLWDDMARYSVRQSMARREISPRLSARERTFMIDALLDGPWRLVRENMMGPPQPDAWQ